MGALLKDKRNNYEKTRWRSADETQEQESCLTSCNVFPISRYNLNCLYTLALGNSLRHFPKSFPTLETNRGKRKTG